ncbi:uncharacterized protein CMC5_002190 [Chondromyces crocatus]|uniref:Secreted protein n=2 Tax=Chondromyces crocatus TaxID=52 RepID=A0A0K1E5F8_CHOCO|nr:uncharacterized protein CMC5_002190 [Chondromyces crocatus]
MRAENWWGSCLIAPLLAACVAGCSGADGGSGDRDDDDGEAMRVTNALYRVPVPEELEPWATYPAPDTELDREEGDWVKIEYTFPTWIVGTVQQVELEGRFPAGATSFPVSAGPHGDGVCTVEGTRFVCTENLPGLVVDRAQAESVMRAQGVSGDDLTQRLRVTDVFSVDPIGIIEFDVP